MNRSHGVVLGLATVAIGATAATAVSAASPPASAPSSTKAASPVVTTATPRPRVAPATGRPAPASGPPSYVAVQDRLYPVAEALQTQGEGRFAASYSSLAMDLNRGTVTLWATSRAAASQIIAAAVAAHPGLDTTHVVVRVAPYTRRTLDRGADRVMFDTRVEKRYSLGTAGPAGDAHCLLLTSYADYARGRNAAERAKLQRAVADLARIAGVPVSLRYQPMLTFQEAQPAHH